MSRVLVLAPFDQRQLDRLTAIAPVDYESWLETRRLYDPEELAARLHREGVEVLVVESDFVFEEVFEAAPGLRFVGICRGATNQIDVDAATSHGVVVVNTPGRNARAVAEHALGLMLALARRIPASHRYVVEGRWENPMEPYVCMRGVELAGATAGVIGLGAIGREVARICAALGMEVLAFDPYTSSAPDSVELVDLVDLITRARFVSIHVPLTAETEGMLDARHLAMMAGEAYLVNLSDARVVDQQALADALAQRRIAGAALDVFETHPVSPQSPFLSLDNVVLTPHLAGATAETVQRHSKMMADDILSFFEGRRPINLVNSEVWESRG